MTRTGGTVANDTAPDLLGIDSPTMLYGQAAHDYLRPSSLHLKSALAHGRGGTSGTEWRVRDGDQGVIPGLLNKHIASIKIMS